MDKHSYPQGGSICQCVGECARVNSVFVCDFKGGRMRGSPLWHWPPLSFMFHIWHDYKHTHKCTDTHPRVTKNPATALSACQWLDSPRSLDGLRDTVTVSQNPHRQPWDKKLIITLRTLRWMAGGHTMMRRKEWNRGNRPEAYCGDGAISTSATAATQTGRLEHTQKCIHTHTAVKATQMGSSVTSDYPPATLTWRDWGHMNASVALSDV